MPYASPFVLFSSLPALSFFPPILAPSLPTFLLSFMEEISTTDRPTDRCFDRISDSSFSKRHADRPTDRRNAFLDIDSWTKSTTDRPTDRPTAQPPYHRKKPSVGRSVGRSVPPSIKITSFSWFLNQSIESRERRPIDRRKQGWVRKKNREVRGDGDRSIDGNRDGRRKKRGARGRQLIGDRSEPLSVCLKGWTHTGL